MQRFILTALAVAIFCITTGCASMAPFAGKLDGMDYLVMNVSPSSVPVDQVSNLQFFSDNRYALTLEILDTAEHPQADAPLGAERREDPEMAACLTFAIHF